jgi:hypothetical protein
LRRPVLPAIPVPIGVLQRKCACGQHGSGGECEECRKKEKTLQRKSHGTGRVGVPPIVHDVLRSPGQPLDSSVRAFMSPRFGRDFSQVRVHRDAQAAESATAVGALAYTVGKDVVFGRGQYSPGSSAGQKLLAHELTHVVQQGCADHASRGTLEVGSSTTAYERESEQVAERITKGTSRLDQFTLVRSSLLQRTCSPNGRWMTDYDGCSVPKLVKLGIHVADGDNPTGASDTQFRVACARHDECYQTCNPPLSGSKIACDKRMYGDMREVCMNTKHDTIVRDKCLTWARKYYIGLRLFGQPSFVGDQAKVCGCELQGLPKRLLPTG